jgi:tRNA 2-selenouridine synthase
MSSLLSPEEFLNKFDNEKPLLIDARSEKEYIHAQIPGAVNIPLLNNEHRHLVGIEYKKNGREAAVSLGFELVGPHFHKFIKKADELSKKKEAMIYCWRGGMRSSIMAWVLSMAGYKISLLKGGYKSFRNLILSQFAIPRQILILGGHTGCGKTELLKELNKLGQSIVDLEDLANHKGSAFGSLGLPEQPSNEHFENLLGCILRRMTHEKLIWVEAESHSIGRVKIPDDFFDQLQNAPLIEIIASRQYRMKRIKDEYCIFPKEQLAGCTEKLSKRLGNQRLSEALSALSDRRFDDWLEILMDYYDKTYLHSLNERKPRQKSTMTIDDSDDLHTIAERLIALSGKIKLKSTL